jgi:endonuclease/exonuclease/phosphatase family metal-dependent hydrolase
MSQLLRVATFNVENLDDVPGAKPTLAERIVVMRPQFLRMRADIVCLQEVHGQEPQPGTRQLVALEKLLQGTPYENYHIAHTLTTTGQAYDKRNLVVVCRFPVLQVRQIRQSLMEKPLYRPVTANPAEQQAKEVTWERPILYVTLDLGQGRTLHLLVVHLKSKIPVDIPGQKINAYKWRTVPGWAEGYFLASMKRVGQALDRPDFRCSRGGRRGGTHRLLR